MKRGKPMCRSAKETKEKHGKRPLAKKYKKKSLKQTFSNKDGTHKESSIEKKVRLFLDSAGIFYVQEKYLTWNNHSRAFDFYITDGSNYTFVVECHGDYFHYNEESGDMVPKHQQKSWRNDVLKKQICKELGIPLLTFFEHTIKDEFDVVKKTILDRIKKATR